VGRFIARSLLEVWSPLISGGVAGRGSLGVDLDIGDGLGEGSREEQGEICFDLLSKGNNRGDNCSGFFLMTPVGISSEESLRDFNDVEKEK
jgi:hypothetical protein